MPSIVLPGWPSVDEVPGRVVVYRVGGFTDKIAMPFEGWPESAPIPPRRFWCWAKRSATEYDLHAVTDDGTSSTVVASCTTLEAMLAAKRLLNGECERAPRYMVCDACLQLFFGGSEKSCGHGLISGLRACSRCGKACDGAAGDRMHCPDGPERSP